MEETHKKALEAFTAQLETLGELQRNEQPPPATFDPRSVLNRELLCDAVLTNPLPYVLNIGCGFAPTSIGQRVPDGNVPVYIVGADPKAYAIGEALGNLARLFPAVASARRFILPIVAEELAMAVPPASFDAVWSDDTILDSVDPLRVVTQALRALKPGGVACIKVGKTLPEGGDKDALWHIVGYDGSKMALKSQLDELVIHEVRGERVEVHTLVDGTLMLKVRRQPRTMQDVEAAAKRIVLPFQK